MADEHDILIKEVDDDLQRERLQKLWEQYSGYIVAVAAAIIIGVGGFKYMEHRRQTAAETAGAAYVSAVSQLRDNKRDDAQKAFDALSRGQPGLGALAKLRMAAADREAGKIPAALTTYDTLAADRSIDPLLSDFARLQSAMLTIDTANWTDMQNRLTPLNTDTNAWRHAARELLGLAAQKAGQVNEARTYFGQLIGDSTTPAAIGERAKMVMAILTEAELAKTNPATQIPVKPEMVAPASVSPTPVTTAPATAAPETPATEVPAKSAAPAKKTK
jgi:hypothetical protein